MIFLVLSIFTTTLLFVHFKLFGRLKIDTFQAIVVNYGVCVLLGSFIFGGFHWFEEILSFKPWVLAALAIGVCFVFVFLLTGVSTQILGMQITTVAGKMALVVPPMASYWLLKKTELPGLAQILGLVLALLAVWLSSWKPAENRKGGWIGFSLPILVFVGMGATDTFINYTNEVWLESGKEDAFTLIVFFAAFLVGFFISLFRLLSTGKFLSFRSFLGGVSLGIPNYFSLFFLLLALQVFENNGALVFPVSNLGVILMTTLFSFGLFKEKLFLVNWIGLFFAIAALILLVGI